MAPTSAVLPHNLPVALSSFIGRTREMQAVDDLLVQARCVTVTGPGGAGKTRLVRELAARIASDPNAHERWPDGVWWVELAPVRDGADIANALATTLHVNQAPGRTLHDGLLEAIADRRMLLVLDNCEHVVEPAALLTADMLAFAPGVSVLATSRERLQIDGEVAWSLPALGTAPAQHATAPADNMLEADAVRLFVERTQAVQPAFRLHDENARTVGMICARLDGMPLALELAAAAVPVFGIDGLASRLDDALSLLSRGRRTSAARHQTLRAVLDWSFALVDAEARCLLARLAVFRGSVGLEAIEAVCRGDGSALPRIDLMTSLGRLVEHSLVEVREEQGETRYRLLETVRQYGQQHAGEEWPAVRARHARWMTDVAVSLQDAFHSPARGRTVQQLRLVIDEIQAALDWACGEDGDPVLAVELAGALGWFWISGLPWEEGRVLVRRALSALDAQGIPDASRPISERVALGRLFYPLEGLAYFAGDVADMLASGGRNVALWETVEAHGNLTAAQRSASFRARALCHQLMSLAHAMRGDAASAAPHMQASVDIAEASREPWLGAVILMRRALASYILGDLECATADYEAAIPRLKAIGEWWFLSLTLEGMATVALARGDVGAAVRYGRESILVLEPEPDAWFISRSLDTLASVYVRDGEATGPARALQAATLFGAGEALRRQCGAGIIGSSVERHEQTRDVLARLLGDARFAQVMASAQRYTLSDVFAMMQAEADAEAGHDTSLARHETAEHHVVTRVSLQLFGGFSLARDGVAMNEAIASGKVRELLCFLSLVPKGSKEQIGLALWPDASPAQLRNAFHVTLHHLRRQLGNEPFITFAANSYRLERTPDAAAILSIDVDAVVAAQQAVMSASRRGESVTPEQLYRWLSDLKPGSGDLLEATPVGEWVDPIRDSLRAEWALAMESLVRLFTKAGDTDGAIESATLLLQREPLRESTHRLLIQLLVQREEPARALDHFRRLERLLRDEVGARPAAETRALVQNLIAG